MSCYFNQGQAEIHCPWCEFCTWPAHFDALYLDIREVIFEVMTLSMFYVTQIYLSHWVDNSILCLKVSCILMSMNRYFLYLPVSGFKVGSMVWSVFFKTKFWKKLLRTLKSKDKFLISLGARNPIGVSN